MAVVLTYGASLPVIKMGRMAGQYAKPRSADTETRDGVTLPAYRGDIVNAHAFTPEARGARPGAAASRRTARSASTLNLLRAFTTGRLRRPAPGARVEPRLHGATRRTRATRRPRPRSTGRSGSWQACGADFDALRTVEFFSSHEALLLDYERPLTRIDSRTGLPYDCSAHFLWIGERTRQLDGAHVDFLSRVRNPHRRQARPDDDGRRRARAHRPAQPRRRAGPADVHHADGRRHGPRRAARARGEGHRRRVARHLGVRPDARQHHHVGQRVQDPPVHRRPRRGARVLRGAPRPRARCRAGCTSS